MNCSSIFHGTPSTYSHDLSPSRLLPLCVDPAGTQFFALLGREQIGTSGGSTPADVHFHVFLLQLVKVFCIFCAEFFTGLSCRPSEIRDGVLYPSSPSLNVVSASVCAKL